MKKYLVLFLCMLMSLCTIGVNAAEPVATMHAMTNTTVGGSDTLEITVSNAPMGSLLGIVVLIHNEVPYYVADHDVDEATETVSVDLNSSVGTKLEVWVSVSEANQPLTKTVWYYSNATQQAAIQAVIDSLTSDVTTPAVEIDAQKDILGIDTTGLYARLTNQSATAAEVATKVKSLQDGGTTVDAKKFNEVFNERVLVAALNQKNTTLLKELINNDATGFSTSAKEKGWYDAVTDKDGFLSSMVANKNFTDVSSFNNALKAELLLKQINGLHVTQLLPALFEADGNYQEGSNVFDIDVDAYDDLEDYQQEYFITLLNAPYTSLSVMESDFADALTVAAAYTGISDGGNVGNVGNGSNSSNGGGFSSVAKLPSAEGATGTGFTDIGSVSWAKEAIETFAKEGIVSGTGNNQFSPNANVTREQFVKMLLGAFEIKVDKNYTARNFADANESLWYYDYIQKAASLGIASGYGDSFGVGDSITREDMAVMVYNAAKLKNVSFAAKTDSSATDYEAVSDYAKEAVDTLFKAGVINGVGGGSYAPKQNATRAQAVKLLYELWRVAQ